MSCHEEPAPEFKTPGPDYHSSISDLLYPVVEKFVSINGEGQKSGQLAAFIRMKGCNLTCSYCDTAWANESACPCEQLSVQDLLEWLISQQVSNVTLTGGEPLLVPGIGNLIEAVGASGMEVEIETNGSVDISPFHNLAHRPAFTLDYKCPDSGMESSMLTTNYSLLCEKDTVKFVVSSLTDLNRAYEISSCYHLGRTCSVYLSAVFGKIGPEELADFMISHHWNDARLQLQLHKYIWPAVSRGV